MTNVIFFGGGSFPLTGTFLGRYNRLRIKWDDTACSYEMFSAQGQREGGAKMKGQKTMTLASLMMVTLFPLTPLAGGVADCSPGFFPETGTMILAGGPMFDQMVQCNEKRDACYERCREKSQDSKAKQTCYDQCKTEYEKCFQDVMYGS